MIYEPLKMSGNKTTSAVIASRPSVLGAIDISPPDTGITILKIYDNPSSASGSIVARIDIAAGTDSVNNIGYLRQSFTGLYAELSGTYTGTINYNIGYLTQ